MSTRTPVRVLAPPTFATIAVTLFLAFPANATAQTTATANVVHDPALLQALEYRSVGPHRGGRVTAVTGVVSDVSTYYMGSSDGGVWKTTDGGNTWGNVSDGFFQAGSMGALAVATSPRGSACTAPLTLEKPGTTSGWDDAGQISRVRVHPRDPDLVYAAVLGTDRPCPPPWMESLCYVTYVAF